MYATPPLLLFTDVAAEDHTVGTRCPTALYSRHAETTPRHRQRPVLA